MECHGFSSFGFFILRLETPRVGNRQLAPITRSCRSALGAFPRRRVVTAEVAPYSEPHHTGRLRVFSIHSLCYLSGQSPALFLPVPSFTLIVRY